jgi:predicted molibdopterin-dependent oxidoreductase YjgC
MTAFVVDGREVAFQPGDSIAAALMRSGTMTFRHSRTGEARGLYCGIGVCNDCLVTVDGRPNVRACIAPATAGAQIETGTAG